MKRIFLTIFASGFVSFLVAQEGISHELRDADQVPACSVSVVESSICITRVSSLHPTQFAVGMIAVKERQEKLKKLSEHELEKFKRKNPEEGVVGPGGTIYIVDRHHLAVALKRQGIPSTYVEILANYSKMTIEEFWTALDAKHWVYPYDENGKGPLPFRMIPASIDGLKDDPYRSLSAAVREAGGFKKTSIPFAEFQWAQFFRTRIDRATLEKNFDQQIEVGVKLARSPEAEGLPGYQP